MINEIPAFKSFKKRQNRFGVPRPVASRRVSNPLIQYFNHADGPFEIYVDGQAQGVVPAHGFKEVSVEAGVHTCKVVQTSGYTFFATQYTREMTVKDGQNLMWSWGD